MSKSIEQDPSSFLTFDERWVVAETLSPDEKRKFLESEMMRIFSDTDEIPSPGIEFKYYYIDLELDPREVEESTLPEMVKEFLLSHFNNPIINRYGRMNIDGRTIQLWGIPKISLLANYSQGMVRGKDIILSVKRELGDTYDLFGSRRKEFGGRTLYLGIPAPNSGAPVAVGINQNFYPHPERGKMNEMVEYVNGHKWLVARELFRFAINTANSHRASTNHT